jgi:hypothetical protein
MIGANFAGMIGRCPKREAHVPLAARFSQSAGGFETFFGLVPLERKTRHDEPLLACPSPETDAGKHSTSEWPAHRLGIKGGTPGFGEIVEPVFVEELIQDADSIGDLCPAL